MGFFGRKNKNKSKDKDNDSNGSASKKAPLLEDPVRNEAEEPELITRPPRPQQEDAAAAAAVSSPTAASQPPCWTDIDGHKAKEAQLNDPEEGGDTDLTLPPGYRTELVDRRATWPERFQRARDMTLYYGTILFTCGGASTSVLLAVYSALAIALVAMSLLLAGDGASSSGSSSFMGLGKHPLNVAFVGNSYFFVNDLPRLFEKVTGDAIFQDSCLHGSGSILNLLKTGNGMYYKWKSANAMQGGHEWTTSGNTLAYLYDYGSCSVPQLLTGQDAMLSYQNQYGHYVDDGTNPCIQDSNYLDYENSFNYSSWDYVVIVDQSKRMCFDDARQEALMGFNYTYGPLLDRVGAVPILVQPHAFWSSNVNMTGLTDIPTFTSMIMDGAVIYQDYLDTKLVSRTGFFSSRHQKTKIAPVGNAYLSVWEEDETLWQKLFLEDGIHPSGYGSLLYALVLHGTIYGHVPPRSRVVTDDPVQHLFSTARKLHANTTIGLGMPTKSEALQLWKIARKVTQYRYTPSSLKNVGGNSATSSSTTTTDSSSSSSATDDAYYNNNNNNGN